MFKLKQWVKKVITCQVCKKDVEDISTIQNISRINLSGLKPILSLST